ncbi:hypothetical protein L6164_027850 [Bauhinia variegata]|uniref:Uncharacterized protein n=1 Tax=Bauhinia variegata TaxID=167791 RepID=A0ACB9LUM1_BAUVA|nr:hypothetical protein L6164_027850 [Bauhinia variegata]
MEPVSADSSSKPTSSASDIEHHPPSVSGQSTNAKDSPSFLSTSSVSSWTRNLKFLQPLGATPEHSHNGNTGMSVLSSLTSGIALKIPPMPPVQKETVQASSGAEEPSLIESFTKGLVDSSKSAVKAMQIKARHFVSQNNSRYQEEGFDLDMTYITENIIAMGFPGGDFSSGILGFFEGFYRNHMEEVIKFFETHHKGKFKVYNLCSERLYDVSLFQGKVASFPFDDHNCPPVQLIASFCQSAYSWLKEDIQNVVVVHCKAGMGRTGLMICSLLLFLKFFPTAEEAIDYYNKRRCTDGKALHNPSQIRYVKYYERTLTYFNGKVQPGRRCMLRGFRLQKCPYWIRPSITISDHNGILFTSRKHPKTKDLMPEDFWISTAKKGVLVFALPGEPGLAELVGDFKIHFHDRQGDLYCWLNTNMIENRTTLEASDLDGFDKRKIPAPGLQVDILMIDYDGTLPTRTKANPAGKGSGGSTGKGNVPASGARHTSNSEISKNGDDDVFSDSDEETRVSECRKTQAESGPGFVAPPPDHIGALTRRTDEERHATSKELTTTTGEVQRTSSGLGTTSAQSVGESEFKAMAADASVFTFGEEEDFDSD